MLLLIGSEAVRQTELKFKNLRHRSGVTTTATFSIYVHTGAIASDIKVLCVNRYTSVYTAEFLLLQGQIFEVFSVVLPFLSRVGSNYNTQVKLFTFITRNVSM